MNTILPPGSLLQNRYRIERLLGQGGFGAVYQATDLRLSGRLVAVKENFDHSPGALAQFQTEASLLANLNHPALPRVTDYFVEPNGRRYLVMDDVEGDDLETRVAQSGRIAPGQALLWACQVLDALEYLHTRQPPVIHRDVKPSNIKIQPDGQAKLVDFGIAKEYNPTQKTQYGARAVSEGYSPIEQYGSGITDARSDIYALGATLYFVLTGLMPPKAPDLAAGVRLVPPTSLGLTLSPTVENAILKAMSVQPAQRFQTAREFYNALNAPISQQATFIPARPAVTVAATATARPNIAASPLPQPRPLAPATPIPSVIRLPTPAAINYASWGERLAAYLIDGGIMTLLFFCSQIPLASTNSQTNPSNTVALLSCLILLIELVFNAVYFVGLTTASGQTVGKKIMGIRVLSQDGSRVTISQALTRYIGYFVGTLILYIGFLWPLWDAQHQALHDKLAGTIVIRT